MRKTAVLRSTGSVLLVLGLTLLLFAVYEVYGTAAAANAKQSTLAEQFDAALERAKKPVKAAQPVRLPRLNGGPPVVARVRIPKLRLSKIVVEGIRPAELAWGPGHYPKSPLPGRAGSVAIAGHRTGWGSPFIALDELEPGDDVILQSVAGTFRYRVTRTTIVNPDDTWVLKGDPKSKSLHKLTLTTCTPKYTSRRRLIVWADQVAPRLRR